MDENFELNLRKADAFEKWPLNFFTRSSRSDIHYTVKPIVVWKTENAVPTIAFSSSTNRSFSFPLKQWKTLQLFELHMSTIYFKLYIQIFVKIYNYYSSMFPNIWNNLDASAHNIAWAWARFIQFLFLIA